jgi:hypothetical protein
MKTAFNLLAALLLAPLEMLHAADTPKHAVKVTQELLNSIHVTPKLIFDPFPAYAEKFLPFAMAASMESTKKGRLWTCWAGGQDGPNAYLLASYSDDQGKSWRDPVFVIDPQAQGLKMGTRLGSFWCDPKGRLWLFFHQSVGMFDGSCSNWFVRCDDPDAEKPGWTEPVYIGFGASLNKPIVRKNGEWILPVSLWERWHMDKPFADCYRELDAVRGANVFVSDDEGGHWRYHGGLIFKDSCFNEHTVAELNDGRLWMLSRGMKATFQSFSADGGKTWQPQSTAFPHVNSKAVIRRLQSGNLLVIRHGQDITKATPARQELTAFLTTDEGKTWSGKLLLDERTNVSYPDIAQAPNGDIYIHYDRERTGAAEILFARFREEDVQAGELVSKDAALKNLVKSKAHGMNRGGAGSARWPLESVADSLVVRGALTTAAGAAGQCLVFDGRSLAELKDSAKLARGEFTLSLWFNPYDLASGQQMLAGKNRYSRQERQWSLTIEPDGRLKAHLHQGGWSTISCADPLKAGAWHLVALVVNADRATLFMNGNPAGDVKLAQPVAATEAPITLGGIWDADQVRQPFTGAVDEFAVYPRALTAEEIAASYRPSLAVHELPKPKAADFPLWDRSQRLGEAKDLPRLVGVEFHVIKKWDKDADGYTFLHGVGLCWHKGRLYASFAHNKGEENTVTEEAQYRASDDAGKTWSALRAIDAGEEKDLAVSHGVFVSHAGKLWAFHGAYYKRMERIHTRAYSLDEATGQWTKHGVVLENGFWALNQPVKMTDGNWIMPGISAGPYSETGAFPAAVAISRADDFTKWDFVGIPVQKGIRLWGESSLIVDGPNALNIARYGGKALALISKSTDFGRTWTTMAESNLPMTTSKPAAGLLSNGRRYLVCTSAANNGGRRSPLTIAISEPGKDVLRKVFVIRHAEHNGPGESDPKSALSYPCAVEHEGKLYVGFSNNGGRKGNLNSAELAVIPIRNLEN